MAFPVTGLGAMVADCIAKIAATAGLGNMTARAAFIRGYSHGAHYGMPLDDSALAALVTHLGTAGKFDGAVALQDTLTADAAKGTADGTAATTLATADTTATAAAQAAVDAYNP